MKRLLVFLVICIAIAIFFVSKVIPQSKIISGLVTSKGATNATSQKTTTLFVPYWTLDGRTIPTSYDAVAYFGLSTNPSGVITIDTAYTSIPKFVQSVQSSQNTYLTVELLDQNTDEKILHDTAFQEKIINQSIAIAKQYHFDGVMLDLEYKALAFDEVVQGITKLSTNFALQAHKNKLQFYQLIYGDDFYQLRPFDAEAIGKISDGVFVMAYDFHKTRGNPGPNFPLNTLPDAQYSFTQMVQDFMNKVPVNKLTVVFGMFGYDWEVNDKHDSTDQAISLTTAEAEKKFLPSCVLSKCVVTRDAKSAEMKATYTDTDKNVHEVWWEDMNSVEKKEEYLHAKGIYSTAFWAWGYFNL